jgi:uncharacterized protein
MSNALSWFEIPVSDFERAKAFYERVLGTPLHIMAMGAVTMGMFSVDPAAVGGAIVHGDGGMPSASGTTVYLNGGEDLAPMLARVAAAGGSVLVPKTEIGSDFGFFAHFMDTEGNRVGLHSPK